MANYNKRMKKHKTNANSDIDDVELTPERAGTNINWFPGHMNKAIKQIKERLKMVDIVLEIRDARSPLVTGNRAVIQAIGEKSRFIVINKTNSHTC